jgi:hypothetical protein
MRTKNKTRLFGFLVAAVIAVHGTAASAAEIPNLKAYLGLHNINLTFFRMNEGRQFLRIGFAKWHSTKPVNVQTWNEYTLLHKVAESETEGTLWRGFQIDYNPRTGEVTERIMDLTITKSADGYTGKLFVNGKDWSGWAGYFDFKPANQ